MVDFGVWVVDWWDLLQVFGAAVGFPGWFMIWRHRS